MAIEPQAVEINGSTYQARVLTRGQVREITALEGEEQSDKLVALTLSKSLDDLDGIPMPNYVELIQWAISKNGLDGDAIAAAKKN